MAWGTGIVSIAETFLAPLISLFLPDGKQYSSTVASGTATLTQTADWRDFPSRDWTSGFLSLNQIGKETLPTSQVCLSWAGKLWLYGSVSLRITITLKPGSRSSWTNEVT